MILSFLFLFLETWFAYSILWLQPSECEVRGVHYYRWFQIGCLLSSLAQQPRQGFILSKDNCICVILAAECF